MARMNWEKARRQRNPDYRDHVEQAATRKRPGRYWRQAVSTAPAPAPDPETLTVTCPVCLAAPGERCSSRTGQAVHWSRRQAAGDDAGP